MTGSGRPKTYPRLVESLRKLGEIAETRQEYGTVKVEGLMLKAAADEIERLTAVVRTSYQLMVDGDWNEAGCILGEEAERVTE